MALQATPANALSDWGLLKTEPGRRKAGESQGQVTNAFSAWGLLKTGGLVYPSYGVALVSPKR